MNQKVKDGVEKIKESYKNDDSIFLIPVFNQDQYPKLFGGGFRFNKNWEKRKLKNYYLTLDEQHFTYPKRESSKKENELKDDSAEQVLPLKMFRGDGNDMIPFDYAMGNENCLQYLEDVEQGWRP